MISTRFCLALVLVAFSCLSSVADGRLFDPSTKTIEEEESSESLSKPSTNKTASAIAIDAATSKFTNFVANSSMCDHIRPDELPEECSCSEPGPFSLLIECNKKFNSTYFNDTIGMKIDLDPCNEDGAKMSLDLTEKNHDIEYMLAGVRAGESKNIPIPGLAMIVPGLGNVGLDVAVLIVGNPDMLKLKIGLNACAQTSTDHQVCASDIPGVSSILPWYILKGTYSFGDVCSALQAMRNGENRDAHKELTDSRRYLDQTGEIIEEKIEQNGEVFEAGEIIEEKKIVESEEVSEEEDGEDIVESEEVSDQEKESDDSSIKSRTYSIELSSLKDGKSGMITIVTKPEWAPLGVEQFHKLMDENFYQDAKFFRVVENFVVQFGIPAIPTKEWDTPIKDDPVVGSNAKGTISFATSGPDTRTTQLFINTVGNERLDRMGFAPIAVVAEGMDVVNEIYAGYGEDPQQYKIEKEGNKYLDKEFPLLSYISEVAKE